MKQKTPVTRDPWKAQEWLAGIFLCLAFSLYILFFSDYQRIFFAKQPLFLWLFGGYIGLSTLVLAEGLLIRSYSVRELWEKLRPKSVPDVAMLCYLLFTLLSAAFSPYPRESWLGGSRYEGAVTIGLCVLSFYYISRFGKARPWLLHVAALSLSLFSLLCIVQLMGYNPLGLYPRGYNYYDGYKAYSGAYLGTLGNVDFVGAFFSLVIPIVFACLCRGKGKIRLLLLLPLGLSLFALVKMQVLGGLLGVFAGILLFLPFVLKLGKKGKLCYYLIGFGLCLGAMAFLWFRDPGEGLLHEFHCLLHGQAEASFGTGRLYIWREVLSRIPQRLFIGHGPDTMAYSGIEPFSRYDEDYQMQITAIIDAAHSEYLNILYHQGVFALLSYGVAILSLLGRAVREAKNPTVAILVPGLLGYLLQAAFGISQFLVSPLFWLCLGLLASTRQNNKEAPQPQKSSSKKEEQK